MRLLYLCADRGITPAKHNGATAHFRSLVTAFAKLGHEVLVLTPAAVPEGLVPAAVERLPTPPLLAHLLEGVDRPVERPQREAQRARKRVVHALGHAWNALVVERALEEVLPRFRPDVVFELYSPFGAAGPVTCARLGVPHVLNVHAPLAWEGATFRAQALQEAAEVLETAAFDAARSIVCNSDEMRDQLLAMGVDAARITVVMNGVDARAFSPDGPVARPVGEDRVVVGFSGSLKGWHGIGVMAEAFRIAAARDERLHLLVVGDGPERKELDRLSAELPGRVTLRGALPFEEVPPHVRAMDVALAPYPPLEKFYFSPLKVLEYMAAGRAIVASDIGQDRPLLRGGELGLLVPAGDAHALAEAVLRLAGDPALRERLGRLAREEAVRSHAWTDRAADILRAAPPREARPAP